MIEKWLETLCCEAACSFCRVTSLNPLPSFRTPGPFGFNILSALFSSKQHRGYIDQKVGMIPALLFLCFTFSSWNPQKNMARIIQEELAKAHGHEVILEDFRLGVQTQNPYGIGKWTMISFKGAIVLNNASRHIPAFIGRSHIHNYWKRGSYEVEERSP